MAYYVPGLLGQCKWVLVTVVLVMVGCFWVVVLIKVDEENYSLSGTSMSKKTIMSLTLL